MNAKTRQTRTRPRRRTKENLTKQDLDLLLKRLWNETPLQLKNGKRPGINVNELVRVSAKRNRSVRLPFLDLWIAVLDEFISWQLSLLTVVYSPRGRKKLTTFNAAILVLLGRIIADATAIRHLILLGYDSSANAVLRSTAEHMELLVAILDDPTLAKAFRQTRTPQKADEFWNKYLGRGRLRQRVTAAWEKLFQATAEDHADWFARWGRSHYQALSGLSHPSFMGSYFAVVPVKSRYGPENWLGVWGDRSDGSAHTIWIYMKFMFPIVLLKLDFPFRGFDKHFGKRMRYSSQNPFHQHVKFGKRILASVILSLGAEDPKVEILPDIGDPRSPG